MLKCQRCNSKRLASINGKTSDCNAIEIEGKDFDGYVPDDIGIGGGDYIEMTWCLDCGQIQGDWPVYPDIDIDDDCENEDCEDNKPVEPYISKYNLRRV